MSSDKDKQALEATMRRGEALKGVTTHNGWKVVLEIFKQEWDTAFNTVKDTASDEKSLRTAQVKMNVIESLVHQIDVAVGFGEQSKEQYKAKFLK